MWSGLETPIGSGSVMSFTHFPTYLSVFVVVVVVVVVVRTDSDGFVWMRRVSAFLFTCDRACAWVFVPVLSCICVCACACLFTNCFSVLACSHVC